MLLVSANVFACHSEVCAPPPVGRGGSSPDGGSGSKGASSLAKGDSYVGDNGDTRRVVGIKRTRKGMLVTYQEYDADGKRKGYTDYDGTRLFNRQELLDKKANVKMSSQKIDTSQTDELTAIGVLSTDSFAVFACHSKARIEPSIS
jgi:hypothetical protein